MASVPPTGPPDDRAAQDDLGEPAGCGPRYGDDLPAGVAMGPGGEIVFRAGAAPPTSLAGLDERGRPDNPPETSGRTAVTHGRREAHR